MTVTRFAHRKLNSTSQPSPTLRRIGWCPIVLAALISAAAHPAGAAIVYAWGNNGDGQLGNGTSSLFDGNPTPTPVLGISSNVSAIAAGGYHSLAIQNGALYAWGGNAY